MMEFSLRVFTVLLVCFLSAEESAAVDVPSFIHICPKDSPDMKACLTEALDAIRPYLKTGYPEYNIPSVEPIVINDLIKEESGGLKIETTDVVAYGGGDYIVKDLNVDAGNNAFELDVLLPKLIITAKYTLDGKLIMVPMKGNGDFHANLTDTIAHVNLGSEVYAKDGKNYLRFVKSTMKVKVGGGKIRLDNLFNGDKTLNDLINDTINKNLNAFIKEIIPYIEKGLAVNVKNTANQIIEPYTVEQLFP